MRELHVVALSEDGRHAVLATTPDAGRGGFRLALDDRLAAALRGELTGPSDREPRGADLTVKDIQNRLRAGESADEIARSAGVPLARVERFAGPVLSELSRTIDAARAAHVVRGRLGRSVLPLGAAVQQALELAAGHRPETVEWTTRRHEDGHWIVTVAWVARARRRTASWTWDPAGRFLTAVDPGSAALGHAGDPTARVLDPVTRPAPRARKTSAAAAPARASTPQAAERTRAASTPKAAQRTKAAPRKGSATPARVANPATTTKPVTAAPAKVATRSKPVTTAARTKPSATARKPAAPAAAPGAARTTKAAARRKAPDAMRGLRVVPDTATARPTARTPARTTGVAKTVPTGRTARDGVRSRASVPGWADVLLSTSPREEGPGSSR